MYSNVRCREAELVCFTVRLMSCSPKPYAEQKKAHTCSNTTHRGDEKYALTNARKHTQDNMWLSASNALQGIVAIAMIKFVR